MTYEYWERFLELHPRWEPAGPAQHSVCLAPHGGVMSCEWGGGERSEVTLIEWADNRLDETKESNWSTWVMTTIHRGHDSQLTAEQWKQYAIRDRVKMRRRSFIESCYSEMCLQLHETDLHWQSKMFWNKKLSENLWGLCGVADSDLDLISASVQEPGGCSQDTKQMHTVTVNHPSLQGLYTYVHPETFYCGSQLHIISKLWDSMTV